VFPVLSAGAGAGAGSNASGLTFRKGLEAAWRGSRRLVAQQDALEAESKAQVDALTLVDGGFQELVNLAAIDGAQLLTKALHERVQHHNGGVKASLVASSSWMSRSRSKSSLSREPHVQTDHNKVAALYSLYVASFRLARRRILGLVNYLLVAAEWVSGLAALAQPAAGGAAVQGLDEGRVLELGQARHSFSIDDDGVVHCEGRDRVRVVYEEAVEAFRRLEDRLLRLATHAVKEAETVPAPNRLSVLHDLYQCEVSFQEAKLRYASLLLDVLEHTCDSDQRAQLLQRVYNLAHLHACVSVHQRFAAADYEAHTAALNKAADLLRQGPPIHPPPPTTTTPPPPLCPTSAPLRPPSAPSPLRPPSAPSPPTA
jgi:hypothetical protein